MLPKSALQTIAACMVYEDEKIYRSNKMRLVRFIERASEKQLLHYIIHGEVVREGDVNVSEVAPLIPVMIIGAAAAAGRAIYNSEFSKAAKACGNMEAGAAKKSCMKRFKMRGVTGQISALKREMGKCSQTARPDKCRKMFMNYISNAEKKLKKIQSED